MLQHNYKDVEHLQSISAIPQIYTLICEANRDLAKHPNVYEALRLWIKDCTDEDYTVHSIVAVDNNEERYYDHNLTRIEKESLINNLNGLSNPVVANETSKNFTTTEDAPVQSSALSVGKE